MSAKIRFPRYTLLLSIIAAAGIAAACAGGKTINVGSDDASTTNTGTPTASGTPAPVSFANDVYPLFTSLTCSGGGCHSATTPQSGLSLAGGASTAYANLMTGGSVQGAGGAKDVNTTAGDAASSLILCKPLSGGCDSAHTVHYPSTTDSNYATILSWINAGAPNN